MMDAEAKAAGLLKDHRLSIDRLDAILVYTLAERSAHPGRGPAEGRARPSAI